MNEFLRAYLDCALWSSTDENDDPLDENYMIADFSDELLKRLTDIAGKFYDENFELIQEDVGLAGHDLWLSHNGHGAGFDDGDWEEDGEKLMELAKKLREISLYVGDDNKIYGI